MLDSNSTTNKYFLEKDSISCIFIHQNVDSSPSLRFRLNDNVGLEIEIKSQIMPVR